MSEPVRLFLDQHIPAAVAAGLKQRGVDVLTVHEAERCGHSDSEQLQFATEQERVMVTFDSDFLKLAESGMAHAGIAWCPATKYSIGQLIHSLLLAHAVLSRHEMRNQVEYL